MISCLVGTFRIKGREIIFDCLDAALKHNYRSIDTAAIYKNEEDIGLALEELLPKYGIQRSELFITSKLSPRNQGYDACIKSVHNSLKLLKTSYLDLYLIHWPGVSGKKIDHPDNSILRRESWKALEQCYREGLVKAIGISNYNKRHLEDMKTYAVESPHVLQVEHHPHYNQTDLMKYCRQHGIHYQAYSSLGTTVEGTANPLLQDETIQRVAKETEKSVAQVLLRWATQQGIGVLPKSLNPSHIMENMQLEFQIPEEDLTTLNSMGLNCKYAWDSNEVL